MQARRAIGMGEPSMWRETLLAALIGASVVALWFLALDVFRGQVLFTPGALGSAVFLGARGEEQVEISALTVLGYTALHVLAFLGAAFIAVTLVRASEREPRALLGMGLFFVVLEVFVIGVIAIAASWLLDVLSTWAIAFGTLLAALAMGLFLWQRHPVLHGAMTADLEDRQ